MVIVDRHPDVTAERVIAERRDQREPRKQPLGDPPVVRIELAVAAAISLFGFESGAALATVVGVLVEVPVMLSVVRIVLRTRSWYEQAPTA